MTRMATGHRLNASVSSEEALLSELQQLLNNNRITTVYQPIVSLKDGSVLGYEALTRGPESSVLHSPLPLFALADKAGLLPALDKLAVQKAIQGSICNYEPRQLLFLNICTAPQLISQLAAEPWFVQGTAMESIVVELTEHTFLQDVTMARRVMEEYRSRGCRIAIAHAGAMNSSLRWIAELEPDYVKLDKTLAKDIHKNTKNEAIVEAIHSLALKLQIDIIAEGIETEEELLKLDRMGLSYGQGYLLGSPGKENVSVPPRALEAVTASRSAIDSASPGTAWMIGDLSSPCPQFEPKALISEVASYFKSNMNAIGAAIVSKGRPIGLMMRERLFQQLAGQYGFSLFWNRSIDQLMDPAPLIVDELTPVEQVSQRATSRDINNLYDLVLITSKGRITGAASIRSILECITNARMESARVASPLTGLPGNLQIHRELNKRLMERKRFAVIYADLDFFKWYNDRYGFQKGDELIQYTADCIQQAVHVVGNPFDFVGHIGGDDFIAITDCDDPARLCSEVIRRFEQSVGRFYKTEDWTYVEDRSGNRVESSGVTLSLSLIICETNSQVTTDQISQAAARLKKQSKRTSGSAFCTDRIGTGYS
jgi:diguanylate cyclase (GGDEF)-like protein